MNQHTHDPYSNWRRRLAGEKLPIHEGQPECGRYKMRAEKGGPYVGVAIYNDTDGELVCAVGEQFRDPGQVWTHCVKNPVSNDAYKFWRTNNRWPDEPEKRDGIGGNNPPTELDELIPIEIAANDDWLSKNKISSQLTADIAANRVAELRDLKKKAENAHQTEKAPHLAAGRAVDKKWKGLIEACDTAVKKLLIGISAWQNAERLKREKEAAEARARQIEEQRKAEEERQREIAALAELHNVPVDEMAEMVPEPEPEPEPIVAEKVQSGGATAPKIGLRPVSVGVIEDYDKVLAHFAQHEDIVTCVEKLVQRAAKAKMPVPGMKIETHYKAQ